MAAVRRKSRLAHRSAACALAISLGCADGVCAEESPWLLGGWNGARDAWSARGLDLEAVVSSDVLGVVSGGIDEGF
jgi:carbohydrate-selective porin OprB